MAPNIQPDHNRLERIAEQVGLEALRDAFRENTFVYGTMGNGSLIISGLKRWAARPPSAHRLKEVDQGVVAEFEAKQNPKKDIYFGQNRAQKNAANRNPLSRAKVAPSPRPDMLRKTLQRELNLFDPGRRANFYIRSGCQMMDLYYGQAGTILHKHRIPIIAEFVHKALEWNVPFSMARSGRDTYMEEFNTRVEGYYNDSPSVNRYRGLTATKEMSRIIRWGISQFGGTIIFEGRELYYSQVFCNLPRLGDTDVEARELFQHFKPGQSTASYGDGRVIFYWSGTETVPTHVHFLSNWTWHISRQGVDQLHSIANYAKKDFFSGKHFLPIWFNFERVPQSLSRFDNDYIMKELSTLSGSVNQGEVVSADI